MKREIDAIHEVWISLLAEENVMQAAENAVLGDWQNHRSSLDWFAHDEDDYKPDPCDRIISCRMIGDPRDADVLADIWKLAAHMGPGNCRVQVRFRSEGAVGHFSSDGDSDITIQEHRVADALRQRINAAVALLDGRD